MPQRLIVMFHSAFTSVSMACAFAVGVIIDEKTMIPIGTFLAVCFFVWRIASKFQTIVDRLDSINKQSDRMELAAIKVESLPCMREGGICPALEKHEKIAERHSETVKEPLRMKLP